MRILIGAAIASICLTSGQALAQSVPAGVYDCYGDIGKFSVIGPGKYMARNGGTGNFTVDGDVLTMTDGTSAGLSYRKMDENWTFALLRDNGTASNSCPLNASKDPQDPKSW
ncbi:hypothetical protein [uncultured Sphingomonas sp.]|uniref:hypothetical protein n=1 Tax=uncultured Sphingomonas sp. TaxID=158754 RepID=UPI0035CA32C0